MTNLKPELSADGVLLRDGRPSDIEERVKLGRHAEIVRMFGVSAEDIEPLTKQDAAEWLKSICDDQHAWIIDIGRPIGGLRLHSFSDDGTRARFSIAIFDISSLGKGWGTRSAKLVLSYAFSKLALEAVDLRVLEFNKRAIASYEKCGFVAIDKQEKAERVDGEWVADLIMEITRERFGEKLSAENAGAAQA